MKIKHDTAIDIKYVQIKKGKIAQTKKINDWLLFDCAKNGEVLGVEILNASKHLVSLSTIKGVLVSHGIVETKISKDNFGKAELTPTSIRAFSDSFQFVTA